MTDESIVISKAMHRTLLSQVGNAQIPGQGDEYVKDNKEALDDLANFTKYPPFVVSAITEQHIAILILHEVIIDSTMDTATRTLLNDNVLAYLEGNVPDSPEWTAVFAKATERQETCKTPTLQVPEAFKNSKTLELINSMFTPDDLSSLDSELGGSLDISKFMSTQMGPSGKFGKITGRIEHMMKNDPAAGMALFSDALNVVKNISADQTNNGAAMANPMIAGLLEMLGQQMNSSALNQESSAAQGSIQ